MKMLYCWTTNCYPRIKTGSPNPYYFESYSPCS